MGQNIPEECLDAAEVDHFDAKNSTGYIAYAGRCVGINVLYVKSVNPDSKIIFFETDAETF